MHECSTSGERTHFVSVENVEVARAGVDNVSFEAFPGQVVFIVGANGSGKQSLLRVLAGLDVSAKGRVLTVGTRAYFSRTDFLEELTAEQNLSRLADGGASEHMAWLGRVSLPTQVPVGKLSRGQCSLLLLAALALSRSDLLFVDAPMVYLDAAGRELALDIMESCADAGRTVVVTTADVDALVQMQDAAVWRVGNGTITRVRDACSRT